MASTAQEIRDLARAIEQVGRDSPCWSVVHSMVMNLTNHLQAIAGVHEVNAKEAKQK